MPNYVVPFRNDQFLEYVIVFLFLNKIRISCLVHTCYDKLLSLLKRVTSIGLDNISNSYHRVRNATERTDIYIHFSAQLRMEMTLINVSHSVCWSLPTSPI